MSKHWYYICTQRPACPGSIPRGVVGIVELTQERAQEIGHDGYDLIWYDRKLTEHEVYEYELKAVDINVGLLDRRGR